MSGEADSWETECWRQGGGLSRLCVFLVIVPLLPAEMSVCRTRGYIGWRMPHGVVTPQGQVHHHLGVTLQLDDHFPWGTSFC